MSISQTGFGQAIACQIVRAGKEVKGRARRVVAAALGQESHVGRFTGRFTFQLVGADGEVKNEGEFDNGVVNEGLDRILNTMFDSKTQIAAGAWYLGLISSVSFSALAAGDAYDSHAGWTEAGVTNVPDYTGARKAWDPDDSTAQSSSNSTTVDFAMTETGTVKGIFLSSVVTKDDATPGANNVLWATGLFPGGDQAVVNGDTLKITYTVNAAAA